MFEKVNKFITITQAIQYLTNFRTWRLQPICVFILTKIGNFFSVIGYRRIRILIPNSWFSFWGSGSVNNNFGSGTLESDVWRRTYPPRAAAPRQQLRLRGVLHERGQEAGAGGRRRTADRPQRSGGQRPPAASLWWSRHHRHAWSQGGAFIVFGNRRSFKSDNTWDNPPGFCPSQYSLPSTLHSFFAVVIFSYLQIR